MDKAILHNSQKLIFRQWSRKKYAIFASLGKEVSIGHVDVDICDKAINKDSNISFLTQNSSNGFSTEIEDEEINLLDETEFGLNDFFITSINTEESPHSFRNNIKLITYSYLIIILIFRIRNLIK